jgi:hypothetical protein
MKGIIHELSAEDIAMLQTTIVPKEINDRPEWRHAVTRAGEWIAEELGRWKSDKHFVWRVTTEPGREAMFDLRMEAEDCTVSTRFDWFELNNEKLFKSRVNDMWGDLIQATLRAQVERLNRMSEEWRKEAPVGAD